MAKISHTQGNAPIRTLRRIYGQNFAHGFADPDKLSDVLHRLDEPSLTALRHDHEHGALDGKISQHSEGRDPKDDEPEPYTAPPYTAPPTSSKAAVRPQRSAAWSSRYRLVSPIASYGVDQPSLSSFPY